MATDTNEVQKLPEILTEYRVATSDDLPVILKYLQEGNKEAVLYRSLMTQDMSKYSLLEVCKGPFTLSGETLEGLSLDGEYRALQISYSSRSHIWLKRGSEKWYEPEMGGIVLLIPKD